MYLVASLGTNQANTDIAKITMPIIDIREVFVVENCSDCLNSQDAIAIASQLGRLDLVSLLLAVIGLILVIGGVFAFLNLRSVAKKVACEEARERAKEFAEKAANEYLQAELPDLLKEYSHLFGGNNISDDTADDIANAQEE